MSDTEQNNFAEWIGARETIANVHVRRIWNVAYDDKGVERCVVGRPSATRIMEALEAAGYTIVRTAGQQEPEKSPGR